MNVLEQLTMVGIVSPTEPDVLEKARAMLATAATTDEAERVTSRHSASQDAETDGSLSYERAERSPGQILRRRTRMVVAFGAVAALLAILLVVGRQPPRAVPHPRAVPRGVLPSRLGAAAKLRLIAANASGQTVPTLRGDQLLFTETQLSILAHVSGGSSATVNAQATVNLTIRKWSNATGQSCSSITAEPMQFPSVADQVAWSALGLLDSPARQPVAGCSSGNGGEGGIGATPPDAITGNGSVLDVSRLPVSPASLAEKLEAGTTGIAALDRLSQGPIENIGFERAAVLLIGPTTGASPAFNSALFQALSLIPGVESLGTITTHSGATGQAFASDSPNGDTTIVVDPKTGTLLEARNIEDSSSISTLAGEYLGSGSLQVRSYDATIQWIDPIGIPSVVDIGSLPSNVPVDIFATAKASSTQGQLFFLGSQLLSAFGRPDGQGDSYVAAGAQGPGFQAIVEYGFSGPTRQFHSYLNAMNASGLFSSVNVI
jgi:hypothetical protein